VFRGADRKSCAELGLVLDAVRIPARIVSHGGEWWLVVPEEAADEARREIAGYRSETPSVVRTAVPAPLGGGVAGIVGYAVVLIASAGLARRLAFGMDWLRAGRLQSGLTFEGEWWRTVTALTLHADAAHIVANLAFGCVFGLLVSQALGGGVAWLAILLAGVLGNALDAWLQPPTHSAIGSSTAVFGALGVLVALAFARRRQPTAGRLRWLSPVIAAVMILVYTGLGGERTDVLAHVTGLVAGVAVGLFAARLPMTLLRQTRVQLAAGGACLVMLTGAWWLASST
jgi:membrane associated rhomboid family serine protease